MQRLFQLYGKNSLLLDATYKTCKYAIALYFLDGKTNVDYQVVAMIITGLKQQMPFARIHSVVKEWYPEMTPPYGMTDYATEEVGHTLGRCVHQ